MLFGAEIDIALPIWVWIAALLLLSAALVALLAILWTLAKKK